MINLRPMRTENITEIKNWPAYTGDFEQMNYALRENGWLDEFSNRPNTWIYIAELGKQVVGFSLLCIEVDGEAEFRIAIHPCRMRTGFGSR
ncbi:MAG: hypothetical protein M0Z61_09830 [Nitrospiraceae bacterium]|nr:hypothetical protein [Nitrospiraceae bacterium]